MRKGIIAASLLFPLFTLGESFSPPVVAHGPTERQPVSAMHDHSCCPGLHATLAPAFFVQLPPAGMPCKDRPCCVKQGPDTPASLPATSGIERPTGKTLLAASDCATQGDHSPSAADAFGADTVPRYSKLSTILRI